MKKQMLENECLSILDALSRMQQNISKEISDNLALGLSFSAENTANLEELANLKGALFSFLSHNGYSLTPKADNPDLIQLTIQEKQFISHISKITDLSSVQKKTEIDIEVSKISNSIEMPTDSFPQNTEEADLSEEADFTKEQLPTEEEPISFERKEEDLLNLDIPDETENTESEENTETIENEEIKEISDENNQEQEISTEASETEEQQISAVIPPFSEEMRIRKDDVVLQSFKLKLEHMGFGRPEDAVLTVAPFFVPEEDDSTTIPIMVCCSYNRHMYHASSYDTMEEGKNIVTISFGEYELLIRGGYKEGKFFVSILPSAVSKQHGDKLEIVESVAHCPQRGVGKSGNGHIYMNYKNSYEKDGILEVFPVGMELENFVAITRCASFTDYYDSFCQNIVDTNEGQQTIVCHWDGDIFEAELIPIG